MKEVGWLQDLLALHDIFEQKKDIEHALNESAIVAITDNRGIIQFINQKFCNISKYDREELIGSPQSIVNSDYHDRSFFKEMWKTIGRGNIWRGTIKNKAKDGTFYWVDTTIVPFLNENGKPYRYVSIRHDITELKEREELVTQMAFYDPLTLLPNRNLLNKWLNSHEVKHNDLSILYVDVDRFKSINDTFGHGSGDMMLKEVASRLKSCLRSKDFIARHGGDEFIIFLNKITDKKEVEKIALRILNKFRDPFILDDEQLFISASIGISTSDSVDRYEDYEQLIEELIRQADIAMYNVKRQGGNTYCFNTDDQNLKAKRFFTVDQEIKTALCTNQYSVVYQPIVHLETNKMVGVEALLRWNNPKLGVISPGEFIPLLEESGEIISVGKWVLETVCQQMAAWHASGFLIGRASVNVSPIQFKDPDFVENVQEILKKTGLAPQHLELEITEGTILQVEKVENSLNELRNIGVNISIDDFGTGYSSLSYLKRLSAHTLKIDKSFIHDLNVEEEEIIINTIITMGKNLKYKVLAEGVETKEQLAYLKAHNCHEGQGFYWSKPVPPEEIKDLFKQNDGRITVLN